MSLTRPVSGSSTALDQTRTNGSSSLDQVDLRWSSDVDLTAHRERALASDVAAHQADTRKRIQHMEQQLSSLTAAILNSDLNLHKSAGDEMTYATTSCSSQAADRSAAVAMTAMTLRSHVRQIREDLERLKAAQLDCCNCVQRGIDEALTSIKAFIAKQAVADTVMDEAGSLGDDNLGAKEMRERSGTATTGFLSSGSHFAEYNATVLPARRRTITGATHVTADSQHQDLNVRQPSNYAEPPPSSYPVAITTATCAAATTSSSSSDATSSFSLNAGQQATPASPESSSLPSSSPSEIFRRSTLAEVRPSSRPLQGPAGSAVARLFGTSAAHQPAVRAVVVAASPGSRGRRSLHHSWVRPGRMSFSDTEAAVKTLTSAVTSQAAAVTATTASATHVSNHF